MKALNDLVSKVGSDKVLHFLGGGWIEDFIALEATLFFGVSGFVIASVVGLLVVYGISYIKEDKLDKDSGFDSKDIRAAMYGALTAMDINIVFFGIYYFMT